jgi:hypothetical protein
VCEILGGVEDAAGNWIGGPPENGPCALDLALRDPDTPGLVSAEIVLWRLGLPEDHNFTAGDRAEREVRVREGCVQVEGLPPGRYRVQCDDQRRDSRDPPEFSVHGPRTTVSLDVAMPREFRVRLKVIDERGEPLARGVIEEAPGCSLGLRPSIPDWVSLRRPKVSPCELVHECCAGCEHLHAPGREVVAEDDTFDLGTWKEESRRGGCRRSTTFIAEDRNPLRIRARDIDGDVTLVALSVPLAVLAAPVVLPDGTPAIEAGARVKAECSPRPEGSVLGPRVRVEVSLEGHRRVEYWWRAGDQARKTHVLEPGTTGGDSPVRRSD